MSATMPTILATSGGFTQSRRTLLQPAPLLEHALELARPGPLPRICFIGTAGGDNDFWTAAVHEAYYGRDVMVSCLKLFTMPNVADVAAHLRRQDLIWVMGGSTVNLLAVWRAHGLDRVLRDCWDNGVDVGGTTDSFGPELDPVTDGLGFLPWSNCPHYDSEAERRPLFQRLVGDGTLGPGYATDNGTGLLYRGTQMVEALSEVAGQGVYFVERGPGGQVVETRLEPRLLPSAGEALDNHQTAAPN